MKSLYIFCLIFMSLSVWSNRASNIRDEYLSVYDRKSILLPHKGVYVLPMSYSFRPNTKVYDVLTDDPAFQGRGAYNRKPEVEFQVSFSFLAWKNLFGTGFDLFGAYTQRAWWQLYNEGWSRQFRETNYSPELFIRKVVDPSDSSFSLLAYDLGVIHQSNGQIQELSRSWNRVFARFVFAYHNTMIKTTLWYRFNDPLDKDNNPDLKDYVGFGEVVIDQKIGAANLALRIIPGLKRQGAELSASFPMSEGIRFFIKGGYGSGLSLIDYNFESQKLGIGLSMTDFLGI